MDSNSCIGADGKERPRQVVRKSVSVFNPTKREERAMRNPEVVERMKEDGSSPVASNLKAQASEKRIVNL